MLTSVAAYSTWPGVDSLHLDSDGREETDLIQITNIVGIDPVKSTINTSPYGSIDGTTYSGSRTDSRNIVLTLRPNPDWVTWTHEKLRKLLYRYFMPKQRVRLVFTTEEISPVEIFGYVDEFAANAFAKTPEYTISVICPDPYFVAISPTILNGVNENTFTHIDYEGDIEIGFSLVLDHYSGADTTVTHIACRDTAFVVYSGVSATKRIYLNSIPGNKSIQSLNLSTGAMTNLLNNLGGGSQWPTLQPGENLFNLFSDSVGDLPSVQKWVLTYYARYGGL